MFESKITVNKVWINSIPVFIVFVLMLIAFGWSIAMAFVSNEKFIVIAFCIFMGALLSGIK